MDDSLVLTSELLEEGRHREEERQGRIVGMSRETVVMGLIAYCGRCASFARSRVGSGLLKEAESRQTPNNRGGLHILACSSTPHSCFYTTSASKHCNHCVLCISFSFHSIPLCCGPKFP